MPKKNALIFCIPFFLSLLLFVIDILNGPRPYNEDNYGCSSGGCIVEVFDITEFTLLGKIIVPLIASILMGLLALGIGQIVFRIQHQRKK